MNPLTLASSTLFAMLPLTPPCPLPRFPSRYGDIVQLQHVASGAFATVLESAAPFDPECRGVILDKKGFQKWTESAKSVRDCICIRE